MAVIENQIIKWIQLKSCSLLYLIGTFHSSKFKKNLWGDVSQLPESYRKRLLWPWNLGHVLNLTFQKEWWYHQHFVSMSLSCLCVVTPKNSIFPNFNWINLKFSLGVDFRALISKFIYLGSRHIDKISFWFSICIIQSIFYFSFWKFGCR